MKDDYNIVNHLSPEQQKEYKQLLDKFDFTHTITITSPAQDVSIGDVWRQIQKGIQQLHKRDKDVEYCFFICENINNGNVGRPHCHGMIKTNTMSDRQIRDCVWSYCYRKNGSEPSRRINTTTNRLDSWLDYVLPQSISGTIVTNIVIE